MEDLKLFTLHCTLVKNAYLFPDMNMQDYLILRYIQLLRTGQYMDIQKCGLQLKRRRKIYKCTI